MNAKVIFSMWGQTCQTTFDATSELDYVQWMHTCYDKGFIYPIEVIREDGLVLVTQEQMQKLISEWIG